MLVKSLSPLASLSDHSIPSLQIMAMVVSTRSACSSPGDLVSEDRAAIEYVSATQLASGLSCSSLPGILPAVGL